MTMRDSRRVVLSRREALGLLGVGAGLGVVAALRDDIGVAAAGQAAAARASKLAIPKGAIVRTILKDVPPDALGTGAMLFHEHLSSFNRKFSEDVELMIDEVHAAGQDGVSCIVDAGNDDLGRKVQHLRTIGARSGVYIVASGGFYTQPAYPTGVARLSEDELVEQCVRDARAERWGALGEIGSSAEMHPLERKVLRVVSRVNLRLGLPILTHTPHEGCTRCAVEQLDIFEAQGVNPRSVCIGHLSDINDDPQAETAKAIAKRGAFLGFDTIRPPAEHMQTALGMVLKVLEGGYEDHVLLSHDGLDEKLLRRNGGPGYSMVLKLFVPQLRDAGVTETSLHKILVDNPRRFMAFVPKPST